MIVAQRFLLLGLYFTPVVLVAQEEVAYYGGMDLREGLYEDLKSFRLNAPSIPIKDLRTSDGLAVVDIRYVSGKLFWQLDTGTSKAVDLGSMWGFCQDDVVYIAGGNGFFRIDIMGSLSHLIIERTIHLGSPYKYRYTSGEPKLPKRSVHQLLDTATGDLLDFSASGMDQALQHDPVLLDEFRALPKKKRNSDEALFRFLRMYNDRNPLSFPK